MNHIHYRGELRNATTIRNVKVHRKTSIYFPELGRFIGCAPYLEHFIYEDNSKRGPVLFCTCGSDAVITGFQAYKHDSSPSGKDISTIPGELIVCRQHAVSGKHLDGVG